ncbi:hypothetical protein [Clostridium botulinum]|nr:hypothetical protein [Clostridium botulinum]
MEKYEISKPIKKGYGIINIASRLIHERGSIYRKLDNVEGYILKQ